MQGQPRYDVRVGNFSYLNQTKISPHSTEWSKKPVPLFYFCDNFPKCVPIFTVFSQLEQEIYGA